MMGNSGDSKAFNVLSYIGPLSRQPGASTVSGGNRLFNRAGAFRAGAWFYTGAWRNSHLDRFPGGCCDRVAFHFVWHPQRLIR